MRFSSALFNRSCLYTLCVRVIATRATSWLSHLGERLLSTAVAKEFNQIKAAVV